MKYGNLLIVVLLWSGVDICLSQDASEENQKPIEKIQLVADHIIDSNPFQYQLFPSKKKNSISDLNVVDFGRTFGNQDAAVAYAITWLEAREAQVFSIGLEYSDGIKIFLNDSIVYSDYSDRSAKINIEERNLGLSQQLDLPLRKGRNKLVVKSESSGGQWAIYLKAITKEKNPPTLGLMNEPLISDEVAKLTNWLVIGPFENNLSGERRGGLNIEHIPESLFEIGKLYQGKKEKVAWTVPKIEILADAVPIDPIWGSYLNYNYHTAGVAWAMMKLTEATGEQRFDAYAKKYTDFMIQTKPFVHYQMKVLNAYRSVNNQMIDTPLLDFTLAPTLPFIYRLIKDKEFGNRAEYVTWVNEMTHYARNEQLRLNDGHYARLTPKVKTTWVDDMFMGLPYLVHAAILATDKTLKRELLDDAASQILSFNNEVWNSQAKLYQHAQYSEEKVVMPHWSRANGWGIWAITEVLNVLPKNHTDYQAILKHYRTHLNSLVRYQDADGFWKNVIDVDSRQETSGTAIFTMAIARGINRGWLKRAAYEKYVLKGWHALDSVIEEDGTVRNICMGTMSSEDVNYYLNRPIVDDDSHGMLGLIVAAIEVQKMIDGK